MKDAKTRLKELLEALGQPQGCAEYARSSSGTGGWESTLTLALPARPRITAVGEGQTTTGAEIAAAEQALHELDEAAVASLVDWPKISAEAQAGDALLKLAAYLAPNLDGPSSRSRWLQAHESDAALARLYDRWRADDAPELAMYGPRLGVKLKAALVEAVIWRRYGELVVSNGAKGLLANLRASVDGGLATVGIHLAGNAATHRQEASAAQSAKTWTGSQSD